MPKTENSKEFIKPIILRIYGAASLISKKVLLTKSEAVKNTDWQTYNFTLAPKENLNYFIIEAFYKIPTLMPYNGNILVDNASDIELIDCK